MIRINLPVLLLLITFNWLTVGQTSAQMKFNEESERGLHKLSLHFAEICYPKHGDVLRSSTRAAYSINYDYMLDAHWSIGSHNDILLEDLQEESTETGAGFPEVSRPVTAKLVGVYHYNKHIGYTFGIGDEMSNRENILLTSLGADYVFHLKSNWELGAEVSYDMKFHHSNNWVIGFGITRLFGKHHKS